MSKLRCPYPLIPPEGYVWGGVNLVNQVIKLECKPPTSRVTQESYSQFKCLDTLQWDKEITSAKTLQCGGMIV